MSIFTSKKSPKDDLFSIHYDDITRELVEKYNENLYSLCGLKGFSIVRISPFDIPVPKYFVITSNVFDIVFSEFLGAIKDTSVKVQVEKPTPNVNLPDEVVTLILKNYARLSGFSDAWVAIRPSIVLPTDKKLVNFAGQVDTLLNIRGEDDVVKAVEEVYRAYWDKDVRRFLVNNGIDLSNVKLAIVIQKMVQSESAGVVFTRNPINRKADELMIEAVFGLGNTIADGLITPDQYIIDQKDLRIIEKVISPQEWMLVRDVPRRGSMNNDKKIEISAAWQRRAKLSDHIILELSEIATMLEKGVGSELEIEWAFSGGQLWILQTKTAVSYGLKKEELTDKLEIDSSVVDDLLKEINQKKAKNKSKSISDGQPIVTGNSTNGVKVTVSGKALLISSRLLDKVPQITEYVKDSDFILVTDRLDNRLIPLLPKVNAIISDEGAIASDLSIEATANNIPIISNTFVATWMLKTGEFLTADGSTGNIFSSGKDLQSELESPKTQKLPKVKKKITQSMPIHDSTVETITKIWIDLDSSLVAPQEVNMAAVSGIYSVSLQDLITKIGQSPYGVLTGDLRKQYEEKIYKELFDIVEKADNKRITISLDLPRGKTFYAKLANHPTQLAQVAPNSDLLPMFLAIVRKIVNAKHKKNLAFAIENTRTATEALAVKRIIEATGFASLERPKVGVTVHYPSMIYDIPRIASERIDFITIDIDTLVTHLFANDKNSIIELELNSVVVQAIRKLIDDVTLNRAEVYIHLHDSNFLDIKEVVRTYTNLGVTGFIFESELIRSSIHEVNIFVSGLESRLLGI
ncbi:hypothetical protein JW962_00735 [Candidatus Dojkabacteria bacterium]|nr:hypothetical protein [Candidatus Dojkabacteria bacterium]